MTSLSGTTLLIFVVELAMPVLVAEEEAFVDVMLLDATVEDVWLELTAEESMLFNELFSVVCFVDIFVVCCC